MDSELNILLNSIKEKTARHVQDKASEALSNAVEKPEEVQRNAEVSVL